MKVDLPVLCSDADAAAAMTWLRNVTKAIGPGFHPDTPAADYITGLGGEDLFTSAEAKQLDDDLGRAFDLLETAGRDPYAIAGRVQRRLLGMPHPD